MVRETREKKMYNVRKSEQSLRDFGLIFTVVGFFFLMIENALIYGS